MTETTKIDWKRKITSRKLWMAIATFVSSMIVFFGGSEDTAVQVTALIVEGATVVAYIIGEGLADASHVSGMLSGEAIEDLGDIKQ